MTSSDPIASAKAADRMNTLFSSIPSNDSTAHGASWEALWLDGRFLPFERGKPNPALHDALTQRQDLLGSALAEPGQEKRGKRRKALVPGCGRGYDVFLLRSFGWDVVGLEVSETAVKRAEEEREKIDRGERDGKGYEVKYEEVGLGMADLEKGDFFEWNGGKWGEGGFDLIYDYTFLSALPPALRPAWASSMARLLTTNGRLICVEFPTKKPLDSGGPPWALPEEVYLAHLGRPGQELPYNDDHSVKLDRNNVAVDGGLVRIAHWRPERTHQAGKESDWVSVWKHFSGPAVMT